MLYNFSMTHKRSLNKCPACGGELRVTEYRCSKCGTIIRGNFQSCEFCALSWEQQNFLRLFLKSRGNLSEVAKKLGISHPTVRERLKELLSALGYEIEEEETDSGYILSMLEEGKITTEEAIELLKQQREK